MDLASRRRPLLVLVVLLVLMLVSAGARAQVEPTDHRDDAKAVVHDTSGKLVAVVVLRQLRDGKVFVDAVAAGLPPGFHGFHVHAVGRCEPPFASAGGHHNPAGAVHPSHAGDMPVLLVTADGRANGETVTDRYTVRELLSGDGSAIIIHAVADNYANIPTRYAPGGPDDATLSTGDAGGRIACGVLRPF